MTIAITTAHIEVVIGRQNDGVRMIATQRGSQEDGIDAKQPLLALVQSGRRAELVAIVGLDHGALRVRKTHELVEEGGGHVERGERVRFVAHERVVLVACCLVTDRRQAVELEEEDDGVLACEEHRYECSHVEFYHGCQTQCQKWTVLF